MVENTIVEIKGNNGTGMSVFVESIIERYKKLGYTTYELVEKFNYNSWRHKMKCPKCKTQVEKKT